MLNDSLGLQNPGESLVAQMLDKLVFIRLKHQTVSYKRHKTWQKECSLIARHAELVEASLPLHLSRSTKQ